MSDRSNAQILIGGSLSPENLDSLVDAIQAEDLGPAWDGPFSSRDAIIRAIQDAAEAHAPLLIQRLETAGGALLALERLCRNMNLAYRRSDDGHYSYDAEVALWEPGMDSPARWNGSLDHRPRDSKRGHPRRREETDARGAAPARV